MELKICMNLYVIEALLWEYTDNIKIYKINWFLQCILLPYFDKGKLMTSEIFVQYFSF